jgi:hypothetical protein
MYPQSTKSLKPGDIGDLVISRFCPDTNSKLAEIAKQLHELYLTQGNLPDLNAGLIEYEDAKI